MANVFLGIVRNIATILLTFGLVSLQVVAVAICVAFAF
jgi:hypothetical protein